MRNMFIASAFRASVHNWKGIKGYPNYFGGMVHAAEYAWSTDVPPLSRTVPYDAIELALKQVRPGAARGADGFFVRLRKNVNAAIETKGNDDAVEGEAVRRAWERIESADLVVCVAAGQPEPRYRPMLRRLRAQPGVLNVANKIDALAPDPDAEVAVSARSGEGLARLRSAIRGRLGFADFDPQAPGAFTPRQARLLRAAADALDRGDGQCARRALETLLRGPLEPVAEENSAADAGDAESQAISRAGRAKGPCIRPGSG